MFKYRFVLVGAFLLLFSFNAYTQSPSGTVSISKGMAVVPKFTLKWADFDSSWSGFLKTQLIVEQNASGKITINNDENWEGIPYFPAFDRTKDGLKTLTYKMEYSRPSIVSYKIDSIDKKKEFTEVKLSKLNDRIVDIKIRFGSSIKDFDKSFQDVFFVGAIEDFGKSDYFVETVMPKLLKGKAENMSRNEKLELLKNIEYDVNALRMFKTKLYLASSYKDPKGTEYNSNLVNETERVVRTIQKYLPEIKKRAKLAATIREIEGVKIETTIRSKVFGAKPFSGQDIYPTFDSFEFYVPMDALNQFIEAEITDQELVDKSIVLLNESRIKVVLSQFSN
jgi:hypothetical protein